MVVYVDNVIIAAKKQITNNLLASLEKGTNIDTRKRELSLKTFEFINNSNIKILIDMNIE